MKSKHFRNYTHASECVKYLASPNILIRIFYCYRWLGHARQRRVTATGLIYAPTRATTSLSTAFRGRGASCCGARHSLLRLTNVKIQTDVLVAYLHINEWLIDCCADKMLWSDLFEQLLIVHEESALTRWVAGRIVTMRFW